MKTVLTVVAALAAVCLSSCGAIRQVEEFGKRANETLVALEPAIVTTTALVKQAAEASEASEKTIESIREVAGKIALGVDAMKAVSAAAAKPVDADGDGTNSPQEVAAWGGGILTVLAAAYGAFRRAGKAQEVAEQKAKEAEQRNAQSDARKAIAEAQIQDLRERLVRVEGRGGSPAAA